jgi:dihydrofolate reductase
VGKLVEATHVSLGGEIGSPDAWGQAYLDEQHADYAAQLLAAADALLLGRLTYEGLSAAYTRMAEQAPPGIGIALIERMNSIPKFVASSTLAEPTWSATVIEGDLATFVAELKRTPGQNLLKYGNGPLDATLMQHELIDEFHLFLTPVAVGKGKHLFEDIDTAPPLALANVTRFDSGVIVSSSTRRSRPPLAARRLGWRLRFVKGTVSTNPKHVAALREQRHAEAAGIMREG